MDAGNKPSSNKTGLRLQLLLATCLCWFISNAFAQDNFQSWQKEMFNDFSDYKSKQDKEFASFLKMSWIGLDALKPKPLYEKKKIVEPPKAPPEKKQIPAKKPVLVKIPPKKVEPKKQRPMPKPVLTPVKGHQVSVPFFGNKLSFPYDKAMKKRIRGKINKNTISNQWSILAKSDYEPLLSHLKTHKNRLNLNDWAYALLVDKISNKIYPNQKNEQVMFSWFVLIKSGFKSRIAYKNREIFLLLATQQKIYAVQSLKYKDTNYYLLDFDGGKQPKLNKVYTYDGDYPNSKQFFDMRLQQAMITGQDDKKRTLKFSYAQKNYQFDTVSNKYLVDFMKTYPQVHWDTYFNSNINTFTRQQIVDQLRPNLTGLSEEEAVNFLLRFVQTSLKYATDDKQFGYENPLFPEESLFYPASDCEDRSFLFAWLVQDLLGLEVVGLHYPGHIATAVKLNMKVSGDTVRYKGQYYLVADPTYINANIGRAMPKFKNTKVEFLEISKI